MQKLWLCGVVLLASVTLNTQQVHATAAAGPGAIPGGASCVNDVVTGYPAVSAAIAAVFPRYVPGTMMTWEGTFQSDTFANYPVGGPLTLDPIEKADTHDRVSRMSILRHIPWGSMTYFEFDYTGMSISGVWIGAQAELECRDGVQWVHMHIRRLWFSNDGSDGTRDNRNDFWRLGFSVN